MTLRSRARRTDSTSTLRARRNARKTRTMAPRSRSAWPCASPLFSFLYSAPSSLIASQRPQRPRAPRHPRVRDESRAPHDAARRAAAPRRPRRHRCAERQMARADRHPRQGGEPSPVTLEVKRPWADLPARSQSDCFYQQRDCAFPPPAMPALVGDVILTGQGATRRQNPAARGDARDQGRAPQAPAGPHVRLP